MALSAADLAQLKSSPYDYNYEDEDDEEMPTTERELAEDAQWKIIQRNTFTRWANEHLKTVSKNVVELETDFSDGLRLIALVEVLSGKRFNKYNRRPNFRTQKLENVTMCLKFLEEDEGIKIVNIDSTDIVDHKSKLILGLVWTLILHYSISMPTWEDDSDSSPTKKEQTPKQKLLAWVQNKIPERPIHNFTTDWNDGITIGALVDNIAPGLCPDWPDWTPANPKENATEAMDKAEQWLGVPQLIKPEELINPKKDELSMMTYLSQFPSAKLQPGAPLRPRLNPKKVRAYGPGLELTGNCVGAPARFTIDIFSAGEGIPVITVLNPSGQAEPCEVKKNFSDDAKSGPNIDTDGRNKTFSCSYTPKMQGLYRVIIKYGPKIGGNPVEIPKSPFEVQISPKPGDASKCTAIGPGIEPNGIIANRGTYFKVNTDNAGDGVVDVAIKDPNDNYDTVRPVVKKETPTTWLVQYTPKTPGPHHVSVKFSGKDIPNSAYAVNISPEGGPPLNAQSSAPKKAAPCSPVQAALASFAPPPKGGVPFADQPAIKPQKQAPVQAAPAQYAYVPKPIDSKKVYATGRGLQPKGVRVGDRADFKVHVELAGSADLKIEVLEPNGKPVPCQIRKKDANTFDCYYEPKVVGDYRVIILYGGQDISKSPFKVNVGPYKESKIRAYGPGLESGVVNFPAKFTVETNGETGALGFQIEGPSQAKINCDDNRDGSADVTYYPTQVGEYAVHVLCNDEDIPKSPFMVPFANSPSPDFEPGRVEASGPGLEKTGNCVNKWAEFTVNTRKAGRGKLTVTCLDADLKPVTQLHIRDNKDGTYFCRYMPEKPIKHTVMISYNNVQISNSPYRIQVEESSDPRKVKVFGPAVSGGNVLTFAPTYFNVDCAEAGPGDVAIIVTDKDGLDVPVETHEDGPNRFRIDFVPTKPGIFNARVFFSGQEIPKSPFPIKVASSFDVSKVSVRDLEKTVPVGVEKEFEIVTSGASRVPLKAGEALPVQVHIKTPSERVMAAHVEDTIDGSAAKFTCYEPGNHTIDVLYAGQPIPSSPFIIEAVAAAPPSQKGDANQVRAYGPGLAGGTANEPATFCLDTRDAGPGGLGLTIKGPSEARIEAADKGDGTCDVRYWPTEPGEYTIDVTYADKPIPGSPFTSQINPGKIVDVSSVKAYGPGLQPNGVFSDSMTEFTVDAKPITNRGDGKVRAFVKAPSGLRTEALVNNLGNGEYRCLYTPREKGQHKIDVTYEGIKVPRSPFNVNVTPGCDPSRVKAFGPGLEGGHTNLAQTFTVETLGAGEGQLALSIEGPMEAKLQCEDNRDGSCSITYIPTVAGTYDIGVSYGGSNVPGSPFTVPITDVVDPSKVRCYGTGVEPYGGRFNEPVNFIVDARNAGLAPLDGDVVFANGQRRPIDVRSKSNGTLEATYLPICEGPCKVNVRYGGKSVPGSPFTSNIQPSFDASKVRVLGDGVSRAGVPASLPVSFVIDTREAGLSDLDVLITDPTGRPVKPNIEDNNDGTYTVGYKPQDLGNYQVAVRYGGQYVPGAPFVVPSYPIGDPSKVRVPKNLPQVVPVGQECVIKIDTGDAGQGAITCRISTTGDADIDLDIVDNGDGTVSLMYTPRFPGAHTLNIKFGGQLVPDGVITQKAMNLDEFEQVDSSQTQPLNAAMTDTANFHPVDFCLPVGPVFDLVDASIRTPNGKVHRPKIEDNKDGTVTVRYQPSEPGLHKLDVSYNNKPIKGSPFDFYVTSAKPGKITAYGPGLSHGIVNEPANFTIITRDASISGGGGLSLGIEGPSKAEIKCVDNNDGTCSVSYLPTEPGEYKISIKFANTQIDGGPFTAKILGEGRPKAQMSLGTSNEMSLGVSEADISNLRAEISDPNNRRKPCQLKSLPNGHLGISFKPEMIGEHHVHVVKRMPDGTEKPIPNSPFKIYVGENELGDASKVKVYGRGLVEGLANELNEFTINTKEAGYGGLSLSVEGPSKADIECHDNEDGTIRVTYTPTDPGKYIVNVKFADEHVPGSPFLVSIGGDVSGQQMERITRQRELADVTHIGSECELSLKIPATNLADMTAFVTSPTGVVERCNIIELSPCHYSIKFVPTEMGIHTVSVKNCGVHIPGSPFQFTVGPITDGGAHKVKASGKGLERGICGERNEFNIFTREAGAGGLSIAVEGPSKAEIDFDDKRDGSSIVSYVADEPGEYLVSIKFNDQHIPESPFKVQLAPGTGHRPNLKQQNQLQVEEPAEFIIDLDTEGGKLDAVVVSPSGSQEEAIIQQIDKNRHSVRFVPHEQGVHDIHVRLNDVQLMDSPYRVAVGELGADAGRVRAYGDGLHNGRTCEACKFIVNTIDAGSGALAVTVDGPSKVQLNCREVADGYEFTYTPTAPGDYLITVKYAGNTHVPGSPFLAKIVGPGPQRGKYQDSSEFVVETVTKSSTQQSYASPNVVTLPSGDASTIRCSGPGLKHASINMPSNFTVDASKAGNNMLFVGVRGPHHPCEKIVIQHRGRNQFDISYTVSERGDYSLAILWGEKHVPGSPYHFRV